MNRPIVNVDMAGASDVTYDYYLNEQWQPLEVRKDGDADPFEQYVWHPYYIDALLLRDYDEDTDGSSVRHYYTHDANFNVSAVIDESGTILERYHYTPYGQLTVLDADFSADADGASDIANSTTFTGRRFDPETGLYCYRNRYYHAQLGLFISRDPLGYWGDFINHLYQYAQWAPGHNTDPYGLCSQALLGPPIEYIDFDWPANEEACTKCSGAFRRGFNNANLAHLECTAVGLETVIIAEIPCVTLCQVFKLPWQRVVCEGTCAVEGICVEIIKANYICPNKYNATMERCISNYNTCVDNECRGCSKIMVK